MTMTPGQKSLLKELRRLRDVVRSDYDRQVWALNIVEALLKANISNQSPQATPKPIDFSGYPDTRTAEEQIAEKDAHKPRAPRRRVR